MSKTIRFNPNLMTENSTGNSSKKNSRKEAARNRRNRINAKTNRLIGN